MIFIGHRLAWGPFYGVGPESVRVHCKCKHWNKRGVQWNMSVLFHQRLLSLYTLQRSLLTWVYILAQSYVGLDFFQKREIFVFHWSKEQSINRTNFFLLSVKNLGIQAHLKIKLICVDWTCNWWSSFPQREASVCGTYIDVLNMYKHWTTYQQLDCLRIMNIWEVKAKFLSTINCNFEIWWRKKSLNSCCIVNRAWWHGAEGPIFVLGIKEEFSLLRWLILCLLSLYDF